MVELKEKIYSAFSCEEEVEKKEAPLKIDSAILSNQAEQAAFLKNILGNPRRIERIFRASEHNFKVAAFHEKCDNKRDTLTLVRTEFGRTIGGYSHYPWDNSGWLSDGGMRAFLFSLDRKEKYVPADGNNLIYRGSGYGPTFGGGHDLRLADSCNNPNSSYANFPSTYNRAENKISNSQESYANFSGATNGWNFRVVEYEVFQVQYQ